MPTNNEVLQTLLNLDCPKQIANNYISLIDLANINHQAYVFFDTDNTDKTVLVLCFLHDLNKKQLSKFDSFIIITSSEEATNFKILRAQNLIDLKLDKSEGSVVVRKMKKIAVENVKHFKVENALLFKISFDKKAGVAYA